VPGVSPKPPLQEIDFRKIDNLIAASAQDGFQGEETEASHLLDGHCGWNKKFLSKWEMGTPEARSDGSGRFSCHTMVP
jgi:hypothetical protein